MGSRSLADFVLKAQALGMTFGFDAVVRRQTGAHAEISAAMPRRRCRHQPSSNIVWCSAPRDGDGV